MSSGNEFKRELLKVYFLNLKELMQLKNRLSLCYENYCPLYNEQDDHDFEILDNVIKNVRLEILETLAKIKECQIFLNDKNYLSLMSLNKR